ncbi:MAG: beta-lactamase family protein [Gemmatimonadota bacterium]|nr:beta-lactamase family protein [Gemmatimonadota bacterium]
MRHRFALLALALAGVPSLAAAQELGGQIDKIFARVTGADRPGCAMAVARDGRPIYTHAYGMANLEYDAPNTEATIFESGSVAKQFTAAAIVLLAQQGKLSLEDDVRKYVPEVPSFGGAKITIRHLLNHTSGLRDQWGLLDIEGRGPGTQVHSPATTLDLVAHQKSLNFPPGSEYLYSNTGYALLGIIVQRVSGQTLAAFTAAQLFRPIGMMHTSWRDDFTRVVKGRATAYSPAPEGGYRQDMPFTNMIGNGGLLTTVGDLLLWNENLDAPKVGGRALVDSLQVRGKLTDGRTIDYALGVSVAAYRGVPEVSHSGATAGYRTYLVRYPTQHVSIAVLCNAGGANPVAAGHQVADLVLASLAGAPAAAAPVTMSATPTELAKFAGVFRNARTGELMELAVRNGKLMSPQRRGLPFVVVAPGRIKAGVADLAMDGAPGARTLRVTTAESGTETFAEMPPVPAGTSLAEYGGTYASDELDVRLVIVAKKDALTVTRRPSDEVKLTPAYRDGFDAPGIGAVEFTRDAAGKVDGFAIFAGRVRGVRFSRVGN